MSTRWVRVHEIDADGAWRVLWNAPSDGEFQLSARAAWAHAWPGAALKLWLDVQNVTNRRNAEELFYSADYQQRGYVEGLPILPSLGMEVRL